LYCTYYMYTICKIAITARFYCTVCFVLVFRCCVCKFSFFIVLLRYVGFGGVFLPTVYWYMQYQKKWLWQEDKILRISLGWFYLVLKTCKILLVFCFFNFYIRRILGPLTYSFPDGENRIFSTRNQYGITWIRKSKPEKYFSLRNPLPEKL
jgi:hypothetical protein